MTDPLPVLLEAREIEAAVEAFINSPFKIHPRLPIGDDPFLKDRMRAALDAAIATARQSGEGRTEKPLEPNPEWEALADAYHASQVAELGVEPEATLTMLEKWKADAEPANHLGQVTFSRAMLDGATDALRVTIATIAALRASPPPPAPERLAGEEELAAEIEKAFLAIRPSMSVEDRRHAVGLFQMTMWNNAMKIVAYLRSRQDVGGFGEGGR